MASAGDGQEIGLAHWPTRAALAGRSKLTTTATAWLSVTAHEPLAEPAAIVPLASHPPPAQALRELPLAALAVITAVVPGTVWCELAPDRSVLRLHVFDVEDDDRFIAYYKSRYERPLQEIFE